MSYSSLDVFHDLGLPDADELLAKAKLAIAIHQRIKEQNLYDVQVAQTVGIELHRATLLKEGTPDDFSTEELMRYLLVLGLDIEIVVRKNPKREGHGGILTVAF